MGGTASWPLKLEGLTNDFPCKRRKQTHYDECHHRDIEAILERWSKSIGKLGINLFHGFFWWHSLTQRYIPGAPSPKFRILDGDAKPPSL